MSGDGTSRLSPQQAGALYLEYSGPLMAFALGLVRDRELAREVVQITFGKAIEHAGPIPPEGRKAWLYKVAKNEALVIRRRDGVAAKAFERLRAERVADCGAPDGEGPTADLARREEIEAVRQALAELPDAQRRIVEQRIYEEKTFAEIAGESGLPLGTVLTRMRLALGKLEQALKRSR